jgi:hypothetical protein
MSDLVDPIVVDRPLSSPPSGIYTAAADTPAYGWLDAIAATHPDSFLGTKYDVAGRKWIAVAIDNGYAGNEAGQIRMGPEFFSTALRDYHDWETKWWREAIQNSVDAGARRIDCTVEETPEGVLVTCSDDGGGMDEDTLINKFLVFGGTTKTQGTTRGGFGKAKELLVLPWRSWKLHTRDAEVAGAGIDYEVSPASYRDGTALTVLMAPDQATHAAAAISFIEKCELPNVRFTVNGDPYKAKLKCGTEVRDFDGKAMLCHNKKIEGYGKMLVRTMGLYMYETYVASAVEGTLIVELLGSSVDLLTANRDSIRDVALKRDIEQFTNQLAADTKSALRKKKGLMRQKFRGDEGRYRAQREADDREASMLNAMEVVTPEATAGKKLTLSGDQLGTVVSALAEYAPIPEGESEAGITTTTFSISPELAQVMLSGTPMAGPTAVEAAVKQLAWQLDFYLINEVEGFKVPKKFRPEGMTAAPRRLARTWGELCRFVLIQLGSKASFGIGFSFDRYEAASYLAEEDEHWLLLNPFKDPRSIGYSKAAASDLLNPANDDDLRWLYAAAVHECTHMADNITYHDESFATALTSNVAKTSGREKQIRAIKKLVAAQEREAAALRPKRERRVRSVPEVTQEELEARREAVMEGEEGSVYVLMDPFGGVQERTASVTGLNWLKSELDWHDDAEIRETTTGKVVVPRRSRR